MARLLGLDFGTGGVRAGVFDLELCTMLGESEERYATRHPHPGWAEQSPVDWWEALGKTTRRLLGDLDWPEIAGISVATTASTVVVCKRDGAPLHPALLWMDCRAAAEADRTAASRHPVMAYSGGADAAEWPRAKGDVVCCKRARAIRLGRSHLRMHRLRQFHADRPMGRLAHERDLQMEL